MSSIYLIHYGVKGMKWGVRRSKDELKYNKASIYASVNRSLEKKPPNVIRIKFRGLSDHAAERAAKRHISSAEIKDTMSKPIFIDPVAKLDSFGRPSLKYIGRYTTLCVNPITGEVTTLWRTSSKVLKRYSGGQ